MKILTEKQYINSCLNWYYRNFKIEHKKMYDKKHSNRRRRKWYQDLKSQLICEVCGFKGSECISALEFHHFKEDKNNRISNLKEGKQIILLKEMSKCNTVCANCHRKIHENLLTERDINRIVRNKNLNIIRKKYGRIKYKK